MIRERIDAITVQLGFVLCRETNYAIFITRQLQDRYFRK